MFMHDILIEILSLYEYNPAYKGKKLWNVVKNLIYEKLTYNLECFWKEPRMG